MTLARGLTMAQTAEVTGRMRWTLGELFEILGPWGRASEEPAIAVALATASRHLGWHANSMAELIPDSTLLDAQQFVGPHSDELVDAMAAVRAVVGDNNRLWIAGRVLLGSLIDYAGAVGQRCSPHSDAAFTRLLDFLVTDLRNDRDAFEFLIASFITDPEAMSQARQAGADADANLNSAGGLIRLP